MTRRILLFARFYPPLVTGGARRPSLLAQALRAHGAEVSVVAPALPDGEDGIVVAHPQPEPPTQTSHPSLKDHLRTHLLWPDADIRWTRRAVAAVKASSLDCDWVFTTSPPESLHAAGYALKRDLGCRWVADFRDSWLDDPLLPARKNPARATLERQIAKRWLSSADLALTATEAIEREINGYAPKRTHCLPQFVDPVTEPANLSGDVSIVHTGSFSLSDLGRSIDPALEAFEAAAADDARLHLHLVGRLTEPEQARVAASSASLQITNHGVVAYERARALQAGASALLLVASPGTTAIPGKLSEYRATGKPIIAMGEGPWMEEAGLAVTNPVEAIKAAAQGQLPAGTGKAPLPEDAAAQLLAWMDEVEA